MKKSVVFRIAALLISLPVWGSGAQPDIPLVTARTSTGGRKDVQSVTSGGWNQTQTVRSIGVSVEYRFFHPPQEPYSVQCFFVAKNESTKERFIFDAAITQSKQLSGSLEFSAAPLLGSGRQWISIPFSGSTSGFFSGTTDQGNSVSGTTDGTFSGSLNFSNEIKGSKIEGWVVRFVSRGTVLKIESNQPFLAAFAKSSPKMLDAVVKQIEITNCKTPLELLAAMGFDVKGIKIENPPTYVVSQKSTNDIIYAKLNKSGKPEIERGFSVSDGSGFKSSGYCLDLNGRRCAVALDPFFPGLLLIPDAYVKHIDVVNSAAWIQANKSFLQSEKQVNDSIFINP